MTKDQGKHRAMEAKPDDRSLTRFAPIELRFIVAEPRMFSPQEEQRIKALEGSLKSCGQLQPVCVIPLNQPSPPGSHFCLVFGRLRYEAALRSRCREIDALVLDKDANVALITAQEALFQRAKTPLDEANALLAFEKATQAPHAAIAAMVGRDRSYVSEMINVARKLPSELQERIRVLDKAPGRTTLQELARIEDRAKQESALEDIRERKTTGGKLKAAREKRQRRKAFSLDKAEHKLRAIVDSVPPPANDNQRVACRKLIDAFENSTALLKARIGAVALPDNSPPSM